MEGCHHPWCDPRSVTVLNGLQVHPHICRLQQVRGHLNVNWNWAKAKVVALGVNLFPQLSWQITHFTGICQTGDVWIPGKVCPVIVLPLRGWSSFSTALLLLYLAALSLHVLSIWVKLICFNHINHYLTWNLIAELSRKPLVSPESNAWTLLWPPAAQRDIRNVSFLLAISAASLSQLKA